jgi:hypothetical protein
MGFCLQGKIQNEKIKSDWASSRDSFCLFHFTFCTVSRSRLQRLLKTQLPVVERFAHDRALHARPE